MLTYGKEEPFHERARGFREDAVIKYTVPKAKCPCPAHRPVR